MDRLVDLCPKKIAEVILEMYPAQTLRRELESFRWKNKCFQDGWCERNRLENELKNAFGGTDERAKKDAICEIHEWGFGRRGPSTKGDDWLNPTKLMIEKFLSHEFNVEQQRNALTALLEHKGIKIATASKWICFCDQERYAIYDSRVSVSLSGLIGPDKQRIFPVVPGRKTKSRQQPRADSVKIPQLVDRYFLYLDTLRIVSGVTSFKVAEIEMALFMIGRVERSECK